MVVRFVSPDPNAYPVSDTVEEAYLPPVPPELLERHGARVLKPADALVVAGWPSERSSRFLPAVYRANVLVIPADAWNDGPTRAGIEAVLREMGLRAVTSGGESRPAGAPVALALGLDKGVTARTIDAWEALQRLRAASTGGRAALDPATVRRFSLDHLLFTGVGLTGVPWDVTSLGGRVSGGRAGVRSRIPVSLPGPAPARPSLPRRPTVLVPDSGTGPHPWLDVYDPSRGGQPADEFIVVAPDIQAAILENERLLAVTAPTEFLADHRDGPMTTDALIGEVAADAGHGTFIAGVIRQAAPRAKVLAVRIVHTDGVAYLSDTLLMLHKALDRVRAAQKKPGDPSLMIDVISFSIGYFEEWPAASQYTSQLAEVIGKLTERGVVVVAAAGNSATTREFFPAALSTRPLGKGPRVVGVGALNPDGSKALFSNEGAYVSCWADGVCVVSTHPTDIDGSETPDHHVPALGRMGFDPDCFSSGFAIWDGTSFAAPLAASAVLNALIRASEQEESQLAACTRGATRKRAEAALELLR
ncbi:S8 family peptidase [Amycolatopsis speibonae]|uniref:S8 family serine peptidase n=1 Tax=Amycolatopsis speibonae TaxID=1450224 RepID=A0ABV7P8Q2_9PSEU